MQARAAEADAQAGDDDDDDAEKNDDEDIEGGLERSHAGAGVRSFLFCFFL